MRDLDVGAWNIGRLRAAGTAGAMALAVASAGCNARALGQGDGADGDDQAESPDDDAPDDGFGVTSITTSADGYVDDGFDGYVDGYGDFGDYGDYADGYIGYCQAYGCGVGQICQDFSGCQPLDEPPSCGQSGVTPIPLPDADDAVSITFADPDDDGRQELVITEDVNLLVYDALDGMSTYTRAPAPPQLQLPTASAGVALDAGAGLEVDLVLGVEQDLVFHGSLGVGGIGPGIPIPQPFARILGLSVPEFEATTTSGSRMLVWGTAGGAAVSQMGPTLGPVSYPGELVAAATWVPAVEALGFEDMFWVLLHHPEQPQVELRQLGVSGASTDLASELRGRPVGIGRTAPSQAAFATDRSLDATNTGGPWTAIHFYDHASQTQSPRLFIDGVVVGFQTADVDDDGVRDLIYGVGSNLYVLRLSSGNGEGSNCAERISVGDANTQIEAIATGDHDGDGDAEIAVLLRAGAAGGTSVQIIDPD